MGILIHHIIDLWLLCLNTVNRASGALNFIYNETKFLKDHSRRYSYCSVKGFRLPACLRARHCALMGVFLFAAFLSSACSVDPNEEEGGVIGTGIMLRGTVSSFAGVPTGRIDVKSSDGELSDIFIDANDDFSIASLNGTGPWLLRVRTGGSQPLYAIAYENGNRNINTFSDLVLRNWFAQRSIDIDAEFSSSEGIVVLPGASEIENSALSVFALIAPVLASNNIVASD